MLFRSDDAAEEPYQSGAAVEHEELPEQEASLPEGFFEGLMETSAAEEPEATEVLEAGEKPETTPEEEASDTPVA